MRFAELLTKCRAAWRSRVSNELLCESCRACGGCDWPPVAAGDYCGHYDPQPGCGTCQHRKTCVQPGAIDCKENRCRS